MRALHFNADFEKFEFVSRQITLVVDFYFYI